MTRRRMQLETEAPWRTVCFNRSMEETQSGVDSSTERHTQALRYIQQPPSMSRDWCAGSSGLFNPYLCPATRGRQRRRRRCSSRESGALRRQPVARTNLSSSISTVHATRAALCTCARGLAGADSEVRVRLYVVRPPLELKSDGLERERERERMDSARHGDTRSLCTPCAGPPATTG